MLYAFGVVFVTAMYVLWIKASLAYKAGYDDGAYQMKVKCFKLLNKRAELEQTYAHEGELNVGVAKASFAQELSLMVIEL